MFRQALSSDLPAIISLWQEAFGDPEDFVRRFWNAFPSRISYVAEDRGRVASAVHVLPAVLTPDSLCGYFYALSTDSRCRGRGLAAGLLAFAEADLHRRGFACTALMPGEPSLYGYYERLGYAAAFSRTHHPFPGGAEISLEDYLSLRERCIAAPHLACDCHWLAFAREMYGLHFYRTATGCAAASETFTAEVLPEDLGGPRDAMVKWLDIPREIPDGFAGITLI